jgi:hypothetical protein
VRGYSHRYVSQLRALIAQGLNIHIEWAAGKFAQYVDPELVRVFVFSLGFRLIEF